MSESILADVQSLNPGPLLDFYSVDMQELGGGIVRFHANSDQVVTWQGQEFYPWPIRAEGFGRTSDQQPTPKLQVANVDGSITLLCLSYDDCLGAIVTRQRTFKKYLDAVNFPGGINPTADPSQEFTPEIWFIERKASETVELVEFELSSVFDFQGVQLPRRQIIANQCPWPTYRGPGCNYTGGPVAKADDTPTSDPLLDDCGKRPSSCKLRDWPGGIRNYGGFIAAGLVRT